MGWARNKWRWRWRRRIRRSEEEYNNKNIIIKRKKNFSFSYVRFWCMKDVFDWMSFAFASCCYSHQRNRIRSSVKSMRLKIMSFYFVHKMWTDQINPNSMRTKHHWIHLKHLIHHSIQCCEFNIQLFTFQLQYDFVKQLECYG